MPTTVPSLRSRTSNLATYDDQDRLLTYGDAAYTYTPNGELLTKTHSTGTTTYIYDALGNLRRVDIPDGTLIEAATKPQEVVQGDWGFRKGQAPTIRRCECDQ